MTRCQEFYDKVDKDGNFCGMDRTTVNRVKRYMEFVKEHDAFLGFSEVSVTRLLESGEPEARETIIQSVENSVKRHGKEEGAIINKETYGTQAKMVGVIAGLKENLPLKEAKKQRYYSKAEISEHVASFVNWMYDAGVEEKVIVELVVKAVVLERR